jgi:hypothetical protein
MNLRKEGRDRSGAQRTVRVRDVCACALVRCPAERGARPRAGLDSKMVKAVLQNLTLRQGRKYDDPASVASIRRMPP